MNNIIGKKKYVWTNRGKEDPVLIQCIVTGHPSDYVYEYIEDGGPKFITRVGLALPEQLFNTKEEALNYLTKHK